VLDVDTTYFWKVQANDSEDNGTNSSVFNFTVESYLAISLINDTVDFGEQSPGTEWNTTNHTIFPFYAENAGNIIINITINASAYFDSVPYPSDNYQFKVRINETKAFNVTFSQMNFTNMTWVYSSTPHVAFLNWSTTIDDFYTDILVRIANNETPGQKNSSVLFTAEIG
jgi:hypothetical protein